MVLLAKLLIAPLSVILGAYLAYKITDETYDTNYVWWFFGYAIGFATLTAGFSDILWLSGIGLAALILSLNYNSVVGIGISYGVLLLSTSNPYYFLVIFSILAACAHQSYHKNRSKLWVLAVLPTLISALALLV